jgi:hypothetical protein
MHQLRYPQSTSKVLKSPAAINCCHLYQFYPRSIIVNILFRIHWRLAYSNILKIVIIDTRMQQSSANPGNIENKNFLLPQICSNCWAKRVQRKHIEKNMHKTSMHEHVCNRLPQLKVFIFRENIRLIFYRPHHLLPVYHH